MILFGKFHIDKSKIQKSKPSLKNIVISCCSYIEKLIHCNNKQAPFTLSIHKRHKNSIDVILFCLKRDIILII